MNLEFNLKYYLQNNNSKNKKKYFIYLIFGKFFCFSCRRNNKSPIKSCCMRYERFPAPVLVAVELNQCVREGALPPVQSVVQRADKAIHDE